MNIAPWPIFSEKEIDAVKSVLRSGKVNYWTGGVVKEFEAAFGQFLEVDYCVALSNGTVAIELVLEALGVGPGNEVIVTSRSFYASASAIARVGAVPVFADVELDSQNLSWRTVESLVCAKTKAVICVHLAGRPCEMDELVSECSKAGLYLIEDCAQAHGAEYKGRKVGSFGVASTWSFCQDKIMTTGGEGGAVATNDESLYERVWCLKDHGKSKRLMNAARNSGEFSYVHAGPGTNARMTEMQAAIGLVQMEYLGSWLEERRENSRILDSEFSGVSQIRVLSCPDYMRHACYKYYFFVEPEKYRSKYSRKVVLGSAAEKGIPLFSGSCPEMYREPGLERYHPSTRRQNARALGESSYMTLVHPGIAADSLRMVGQEISRLVSEACF